MRRTSALAVAAVLFASAGAWAAPGDKPAHKGGEKSSAKVGEKTSGRGGEKSSAKVSEKSGTQPG